MSFVDDAVDSILAKPPRPGAWRIPYGNDGIIPLGGYDTRFRRDGGWAEGEPGGASAAPDGPKLTFRDACYTVSGPLPFVCGTCCYYDDGACERVSGPYQDGMVLEADTCVLWEPAANLTGGGPVQGDDESEDTVPAMLSPKEYVLPEHMVDELGGEDMLEEMRRG